MKREMMKTANKAVGNIPMQYDMVWGELRELKDIAEYQDDFGTYGGTVKATGDGFFAAVRIAFQYGFVLGCRAAHRGRVKKTI